MSALILYNQKSFSGQQYKFFNSCRFLKTIRYLCIVNVSLRTILLSFVLVLDVIASWAGNKTVDHAVYASYMKLGSNDLYRLGQQKEAAGQEDSALVCYSILGDRAASSSGDDAIVCIRGLLQAGTICGKKFNYREAMNYYLHCQDLCESKHRNDILMVVLKNIGNIYSQFHDYEHGRSYYQKSLGLARKYHNRDLEHDVLYNLVNSYLITEMRPQAEKCFEQMEKMNLHSVKARYNYIFTKALLLETKSALPQALDAYWQAYRLAEKSDAGYSMRGSCLSRIAIIYQLQGQYENAIQLCRKNDAEAQRRNMLDLQAETYRQLASVYYAMGLRDSSIKYQMMYLDLQDEVYNQSVFNGLKNAQFMHDMKKTTEQVEHLSEERDQQRTIIFIVCAFLLLLLVSAFVIYRQNKRITRMYRDLFRRNKTLIASEQKYKSQLKELEKGLRKTREQARHTLDSGVATSVVDVSATVSTGGITQRIRNILDTTDSYLDPDFTIEKLSRMVDENTRTVSKIIKDQYGENFRTLLNELRVKEAMIRLTDSKRYGCYTIKAIAESVGYRSQSNFITVFTKIAGIKPSIYQKLASEEE